MRVKCPCCGEIVIAGITLSPRVNWKKINWSLTNTALVERTGASMRYVVMRRKKMAPQTVTKQRPDRACAKVDWSKSTSQLAKELDIAASNVSTMRRKLAPKTVR